jgi:hypothetical protein
MKVYNPGRRSSFFAREWVHTGANLLSITRSPIEASEKARLYWFMFRRAIWHRQELGSELGGMARRIVRH